MKARSVMAAFLAVGLAILGGCDDKKSAQAPAPREITDASVGRYCGMQLNEHPGPKGQAFVAGISDPVWFSSARDTLAFLMLPEEPKSIAAVYVTDMAKAATWDEPGPGTWIDARKAFYVIGSDRQGGMGAAEAVPFGAEGAAKMFVVQYGGTIVTFGAVPRDYVLSAEGAPPSEPTPAQPSRSVPAPAGHGKSH